jgi:DNA-binding SARP family transcriptional activator/tetratricopeptide (TPR) repeat protein
MGYPEFRLFGEVELLASGQRLDVGTPRQQVMLAALIVDGGRPVAIETLIDRVWGSAPPAEARNAVYSHLSRIRRLLKHAAGDATVRLDRRHAGYVLDVDPDLVDLHRFRRLAEQGGDAADRAAALTEALSLWRGAPLAALEGEWPAQVRSSWHHRRLDTAVRWARLRLRLGEPAIVINFLHDLVTEYPLAEPLESLLMQALHTAGRSAEALERYTAIRQRLADELGTDPSAELATLHQAILRGNPPPAARDKTVVSGRPLVRPAQLPPDPQGFAGRGKEMGWLDGLLPVAEDSSTPVEIVVVSGTAGVGKTALTVHWAHRVRDRFDDGQLYANLRGFDPTGSPVTPAAAVRDFLDALGVRAERIPAGVEAQVGLYRSLLATRRVLIVLDNARDAAQVRSLLPGGPGCLVLVTSRNQLAGLVADGAHPLTLDLLSAGESRELLARRLGAHRVATESRAVDEIVSLCARLPVALAIVAARAAIRGEFSLATLAEDLREARGNLDEFAGSDPTTDARTVFSWSYLQLTPQAARLFRLLGVHPAPDVSLAAAASLAGLSTGEVRVLLNELSWAHLVAEHEPRRYTFHDLLRVYAAEQAHLVDTGEDQKAALCRTLRHYAHSGDRADQLLNPHRDAAPTLPSLPPGAAPARIADRDQALAWFNAEHAVLVLTVRRMAGFDTDIWHLAWVLRRFLAYQGHWHDSVTVLGAALRAARRLGAPDRQAFCHCYLGCAYIHFGRYGDALANIQDAIDLYRRAEDDIGEAYAHLYGSWVLERQRRHREALSYAEQCLDLFRAARHRPGQAKALNAVGWFHALLDAYEEALRYCQQALDLQEELGDRYGQAETLDSLGYAHHHLGRHPQAITCFHAARALFREFGFPYREAVVSNFLGDAHDAMGDAELARAAWQHALDVLDQLGHQDAEEIRQKLKQVVG